MHLFVFILTFVVNFSFYQAGLLSHENERFKENGSSHPISTDYTASTYNKHNRNKLKQITYTRISDGPNDIIHIGNGHNKNNILFIQERPRENPPAYFPNKETNNPVNFRPKNTIRTDQSIYRHISDGQKDIIEIGNGQNRNNVFNVDEGSYGSREPNNGNIGLRGSHPQTNYYKGNSYPQGATDLVNRFGSNVPPTTNYYGTNPNPRFDNDYKREHNIFASIGNGIGNRNTFSVHNNEPNYDNRRRSNTEQNNYEPKSNSWATNTPTNFNQNRYNNPIDTNRFTSIGTGPNNRNTVNVDGKSIRFDSGLTMTTKEHQRRGKGLITPDQTPDPSRGVNNSHHKTTTRTDQSLYNRSLDGQRDIINIGNRHHKNNVLNVDEESRGQPQRPQSSNVGSLGNPPKNWMHNQYDLFPDWL